MPADPRLFPARHAIRWPRCWRLACAWRWGPTRWPAVPTCGCWPSCGTSPAASARCRREEILELGTLAGAEALGLADRLGSITPGKEASLAVAQLDRPADPWSLFTAESRPAIRAARQAAVDCQDFSFPCGGGGLICPCVVGRVFQSFLWSLGMLGFPKWIIAGGIGGLIGAAAWAGISVCLECRDRLDCLGHRVCRGVLRDCAAGEHEAGWAPGLTAAVLAIAAVLGGKYASVYMTVAGLDIDSVAVAFTANDMIVRLADEMVKEREAKGQKVVFPPGKTMELATEQADYPPTSGNKRPPSGKPSPQPSKKPRSRRSERTCKRSWAPWEGSCGRLGSSPASACSTRCLVFPGGGDGLPAGARKHRQRRRLKGTTSG